MQRWILAPVGVVCALRQQSNGRSVDAYQTSDQDFRVVVTRQARGNDAALARLARRAHFTIRKLSGGRFLDAHESDGHDFGVVTREAQGNDRQRWLFDAV